jgi:hypothetical protein
MIDWQCKKNYDVMLAHIISALVIGKSSLRNNLQIIVLAHIIFLAAHPILFSWLRHCPRRQVESGAYP